MKTSEYEWRPKREEGIARLLLGSPHEETAKVRIALTVDIQAVMVDGGRKENTWIESLDSEIRQHAICSDLNRQRQLMPVFSAEASASR